MFTNRELNEDGKNDGDGEGGGCGCWASLKKPNVGLSENSPCHHCACILSKLSGCGLCSPRELGGLLGFARNFEHQLILYLLSVFTGGPES